MAEQLDLVAQPPSPWEAVRAAHPGAILTRVIHFDRGTQEFLSLPRTEANLARGADLYDGGTVFIPAPAEPYTLASRDALIAEWDARWHAGRAA
jgi:hypothetical protein